MNNPSHESELLSGWWFLATHLKNISQIGNIPQIGVKIKKKKKNIFETTT